MSAVHTVHTNDAGIFLTDVCSGDVLETVGMNTSLWGR